MQYLRCVFVALTIAQYALPNTMFHTNIVEVDMQFKRKLSENELTDVERSQKLVNDYLYQKEWTYFDHIPIQLINVLDSQLTLYRNEYYSLPQQLKDSIFAITITADDLNRACGMNSIYKVKGCARSEYNDILLDETYRYGDLLHESIHLYSYQFDRVFSDEFEIIYQEEGNRISVQSGNTHTIYEFFVSAYLIYMNNPSYLASITPKCKAYFDSI